jgi:Glycosyltransferase like family
LDRPEWIANLLLGIGGKMDTVQPALGPLSFVACVSDSSILEANLHSSPCLNDGSEHQVLVVKNCPSAADGLNIGIARAKTDWVVFIHQDMWLPARWDRSVVEQLHEAERRIGPIGVAGVYGVGEVIARRDQSQPLAAERIGWVVDRGRMLSDGPELPARVATLDELLLIVRRDAGLRFDTTLGFHLYGADICLQAREQGLAVVALAALCHHNSRSIGLPEAFFASARVFARKWSHRLPVATPCAIIESGGEVSVLGNAAGRPGSLAIAEQCLRRQLPPASLIATPSPGRS